LSPPQKMPVSGRVIAVVLLALALGLGRCEGFSSGFHGVLPLSCSSNVGIEGMQRGGCDRSRVATTAVRPKTKTVMSASSSSWGSKLAAAAAASSLIILAPAINHVAVAAGGGAAPYVIDEAKAIPSGQEARIEKRLNALSEETGFRVRVLTRDGRTPGKTGPEIKELWGLPDEKSLVVVVQTSNGNVLSFNSGKAVAKLLPDRFFSELGNRLGNKYAVSDNGENGVVEDAVVKIDGCLRKGGCFFVPGVSPDQYQATLTCSAIGGSVFGFSVLTSLQFIEKKARGQDAIFKYAIFLYMPLWGLFYLGLGINPLLQREAETQLFLQNTGAFLATAIVVVAVWPQVNKLEPPSIKF